MASTSSFRFWRKAASKASFKEVTGFDLFYQLIYMSAIASAGISRNKIFEFGASLPRQAAAYFNRVHLVCRRLGYEYSTACTLVGEAADSDAMKSLFLRFADALAAGQPEVTFLTEEADVQGNAYEKEYERDLASLTKWTDAYAAIVVSSALIIIINLVSALIYDMGISMTVGLVVTGVLTAAGGAWVLSRAAPPEVRVHFSSTGPQAQRRTRQLLKAGIAATLVVCPPLFLLAGLGVSVVAAALLLLPAGVMSTWAGREVGKKDREFGPFLRSLGGMAESTGTTTAEALNRLDLSSFPTLQPELASLRSRLSAGIDAELCWERFTTETGSKLIEETLGIFLDAIKLGGQSDTVASLSSQFAMTTIMLRAKREVVASTFSWLTVVMHAITANLMVIILEVVQRFSRLIAESSESISGGEAMQSMALPLPSFSSPQTQFLGMMTTAMVLLLVAINAFAIIAADGGHKIKVAFYFAVLLLVTGVSFIAVPPFIGMVMPG